MADRENMSVEEMLAACRQADGGAAPPPEPKPAKPADAEPPAAAAGGPPEEPAAAEKAAADKPRAAMSVAEIMAAARGSDAGAGGGAEKRETAPAKPAPAAQPSEGKAPRQMSIAEMMAAARGEKAGEGPAKPAAAKAKPAAEKAAPKREAAKSPPEKKAPAGARDTQSILAAARKEAKSGPVSKAEAAERLKQAAPPAAPAEARKQPRGVPPMPEKPAYARPPAPARGREAEETRRGFFSVFLGSFLAVGFTSLGLVHLLWLLGFARFMFPNILIEPPTRFRVGPPGNFAFGMVETKFIAQFGVWIVHTVYLGEQMIFALQAVCTHLGCTPSWLEAEQKFKCPCHGSGFYKDGVNFEGPAPRPLERFAIRIADDGQLEVDKSRTFQEEKGQWTDPASFVRV